MTAQQSTETIAWSYIFSATGENDNAISALRESGCPVIEFNINDRYSLIAEFYRWEIATAIACHILGVNAFDQPDVQDNKDRTLFKVNAYRQSGALDEPDPLAEIDGIEVFTNLDLIFKSTRNLLEDFLKRQSMGII